ncbi:SDR family oxidoreductase (plasmid) [Bartonella sp. HY329]|uniref:SDR family NAD(P)-dependent oxidoreductase n=1 Tax=unclassified Bartonella TaxID=2645622 RepID=UPI0021C73F57|nr:MULTISPECIES: SDR family NAD(P)-dependent oxidoreductase [unclassified Bartonella]UXM96547.1 SDR family oxidoreductase [Bartonella sp. HY329]UXN10870.1 SDR family oxidoreductase [Bartonella sp. HY328]
MSDKGTIIVTGGAAGIGFAICEQLLAQDWTIIAADINENAIEAARQAFETKFGEKAKQIRFERLNVADENNMVQQVALWAASASPLRGLVNSAGIGADIPALETGVEKFRQILDINLIGSFVMSREVAKVMQKTGGGSIVNIASVSGITGNLGRTAYGASKGAVIQMSRILAVEFAPFKIRVNSVSPGPIETAMAKMMHTDEARKSWTDRVLLHRYAEPYEVAGAVTFLLDEEKSSYITGQNLAVDGGFTIGGIID